MTRQQHVAERNLQLHKWINFLAGLTFLLPVITMLYAYTNLTTFDIILLANIATMGIWIFELPTSVLADTTGRKKSLVIAVLCNACAALSILIFFNFIGFAIAGLFSALYWSFWSGTGQAFLDENLRIVNREHTFGKVIGHFMFMEHLASFLTPLVASALLYFLHEQTAYYVLAALDVLMACALVVLTLQLKETGTYQKLESFKKAVSSNIHTLKKALWNVYTNKRLLLLLYYRSFANHVAFLMILILPLLLTAGMEEWLGGVITAVATLGTMLGAKFSYLIAEKRSYHHAWVWSTTLQGCILIICGFLLGNWVILALLYIAFSLLEGLWHPAWNNVLVQETQGHAIATTRSIIFSVFALYTTLGKQLLTLVSVEHALWITGGVILITNVLLGKKVLALEERWSG